MSSFTFHSLYHHHPFGKTKSLFELCISSFKVICVIINWDFGVGVEYEAQREIGLRVAPVCFGSKVSVGRGKTIAYISL